MTSPRATPPPAPPPIGVEEGPDSLLNRLICAIEQRRFPEAIALIGFLREFTTLTKALDKHEQVEKQFLEEVGKLEAARDEAKRLKEQNVKLQETIDQLQNTRHLDLVTEQLNQTRGENASLLKTLGENDEQNRRVKSCLERQAASHAQTIREQKRQIEQLGGDLKRERQRLKDAKQLTRKHQELADRQSGRIRELEVINEHRKGEMLKV